MSPIVFVKFVNLLTFGPIHVKGEAKKPLSKLAYVINQPSLVQMYSCDKCHKKFDERSHLVLI